MKPARVLLVLAATPFAACNCDDDLAVIPGRVLGQVCDVESGAGIAGARLTLADALGGEQQATAAADGSYTFSRVHPGPATVTAMLSPPRSFEVEVTSRADAFIVDPACREPAPSPDRGAVDGQICNRHTGTLVTGAQVIVQTSAGDTFVSSTDGEGRFLVDNLPDGTHVLTVQAPGYQRSFRIEVRAGTTFHLDIGEGCVPTDAFHGSLSGALCDPRDPSGALVGARVTATDAEGATRTDVTDLDGKFFLNALAPGPAQVQVVRAPDVHNDYFLNVLAGTDVTVEYQLTCRADCVVDVAVAPTIGVRPVDIIFAVDTSGSMDDDRNAVQQNLNSFSQQIAASGVDYRVVMIGEVNVPPPLGGSAQYLNVRSYVGSHSALNDFVRHYPTYGPFLREDSLKHFVVITDDEANMNATQFASAVNAWPGFSGWKFHSIVSFGSNASRGCSTGAGYGHQYVALSQQTGGLMSPICGANYAEVFAALVAQVTVATLPCSIEIPAMPNGTRLDTSRVRVSHDGQTSAVSGVGQCSGSGWRFDATQPSELVACEETCTALAQQASGSLVATFGCVQM